MAQSFFFSTGPAAQAAQKQKSCTNKITLMQDWVFRLGLLCISWERERCCQKPHGHSQNLNGCAIPTRCVALCNMHDFANLERKKGKLFYPHILPQDDSNIIFQKGTLFSWKSSSVMLEGEHSLGWQQQSKVYIFWEDHKILQNHQLTFNL